MSDILNWPWIECPKGCMGQRGNPTLHEMVVKD